MARLAVLFLVWVILSAVAIVSVPIILGAVVIGRRDYATRVLVAQDKLAAALLGYSGCKTVSAECGVSTCRFCKWVCCMMERVMKNHCADAAKDES